MFIDDLTAILVASNVGVSGGANGTIFRSTKANLPTADVQSAFITLIDTGGTGPLGVHNSAGYRRPSAQVMAWAPTYAAVSTLINAAYTALTRDAANPTKAKRNFTVNGVWYLSIDARDEPADLGVESGKIRYFFEVDAVKRPS